MTKSKLNYLKIRTLKDMFSQISEDDSKARFQINAYRTNIIKKYNSEKKIRLKKCFKELMDIMDKMM